MTDTPSTSNLVVIAVSGGAMAVFCDDRERFDLVVHLFRTAPACGLANTLSIGEIGESGRDQGHAYGQWLNMAMLAEICWKQGVDLFAEHDNRLLAVGEYFARSNLMEPTPFVPFGTVDWHYTAPNQYAWPHGQMGFHLLRGAYGEQLSLRKAAANEVRALLTFVGLMLALTLVGIDLTALSVLGGAVGVGLGFGLQKLSAN